MGISQLPVTASDGEGIAGDDVTWVKGQHVLQGGALYIFGIKRQTGNGIPQGVFSFSGNHTGDAAADYLLGLDTTYSQGSVQLIGNAHFRQGEAYVQDDWKVQRRLSLNLGLRWIYYSSDSMSGDQVTAFRSALYNAAQAPVVNVDGSLVLNSANVPVDSLGQPANLLNGLVFAGQNGIPSGFFIDVYKRQRDSRSLTRSSMGRCACLYGALGGTSVWALPVCIPAAAKDNESIAGMAAPAARSFRTLRRVNAIFLLSFAI